MYLKSNLRVPQDEGEGAMTQESPPTPTATLDEGDPAGNVSVAITGQNASLLNAFSFPFRTVPYRGGIYRHR